MLKLRGKTAFITGGASGIGLGIAKAAAEAAAKAEAEAKAKAETEAKAAAEAAAKAAAEAAAKAEAEAKAKAEAEAAALPPESSQEVKTPPTIKLTGFAEMTLEYGQAYKEAGYSAADSKKADLTSKVKVTNNVNIWVAGIYTVNYEVTDSNELTARATRIVTVLEKPAEVIPPTAPKITVNGSNPIVLHLTSGTPYKEQKAKAVDYDGKDISDLVEISGDFNRNAAGTYTLTYSVISPESGLTASVTRDVKIVAPMEERDPRTKYGFNGLSKQGGKVTHTGVTSSNGGFMDFTVSSIDNNMAISVQLVDTQNNNMVTASDTFTSAGTKQFKIDKSKYNVVVTVTAATAIGKYSLSLLMPETEATYYYDDNEIPLVPFFFMNPPKIAPIGSNPIILHLGGTDYLEQGARATNYNEEDISDRVEIIGKPDTSKAGTYTVTYRVVNALGNFAETTREVRILAPISEKRVRTPYDFGGFGTNGAEIIHTDIKAEAAGTMTFNLSSISEGMGISIDFVNAKTKEPVFAENFSAATEKQYQIAEGDYELNVKIDQAEGTGYYSIDLLMPEVILYEFEEEEVPLVNIKDENVPLGAFPNPPTGDSTLMTAMIPLAMLAMAVCVYNNRKNKAKVNRNIPE